MMKKSITESNKDDDLMCGGGGDEDKRKRAASGVATTKKGSSSGGSGGASSMKSCQAEKCSADLSDAKTYHRRHKVCEHHAKAQVVVVAGIRQRFCQQCSRFHDISEFDETKRSCRRRLAGHNERRRKNPADIYSQVAEGGTSSTSSSRIKGGSNTSNVPLKDMHIQDSDHRGRIQMMTVQENTNYNKHFHIR